MGRRIKKVKKGEGKRERDKKRTMKERKAGYRACRYPPIGLCCVEF